MNSSNGSAADPTILAYTNPGGWRRVHDPAPCRADESAEEALRRAGFFRLQSWPTSDATLHIDLYERDGRNGFDWLLIVNTPCSWIPVRAPDLPSLLGLLALVLPVVESAARLDAIADAAGQEREARRQ